MAADYDRLFQPLEGPAIPDEALAQADFEVDAPDPAPPMPVIPPVPASGPASNGAPRRPMPVDWSEQPPPAAPAPAAPPAAPAPPAPAPAPAPQGRHARAGAPDPVPVPSGPRAESRHSRLPPAQNGPAPAPTTGVTSAPARRVVDSPPARNGFRPADPPPARMVPQRGWRRGVHRLTRLNLGLSRDEKHELDLHTRIRRRIRGSYEIGVVGLKGGAGKTAVTVALGSVFAQLRGDRILALDADPVSGNLADRVGRQSRATVADLVADKALAHYNDIHAHTSTNGVGLEVLAAAEYSAPRRALTPEDWRCVAAVVPRYYNLVLADCGRDLAGPAARGVLSAAAGLVIVSHASIDGAGQTAVAIDWLRNNGYEALLARSCVVINHVTPKERGRATGDLVRRFEQQLRPGRVLVLPWDTHVAAGTDIRLDCLGESYLRMLVELAAALSDDFDRGERR